MAFVERAEEEVGARLAQGGVSAVSAVQVWRGTYRLFGASPSKKSSLEALLDVLAERGRLPRISPLVDVYNAFSVKHSFPMAAYDMDRVQGTVELRFSRKGEEFTPIGARQVEKTSAGEVVYADEHKVICRRWNNRDCDQTKITDSTENAVFFIDAVPEASEGLDGLLRELTCEVASLWGSRPTLGVANGENRTIVL